MSIDVGRSILIIAICTLITFLERYLPFAVFGRREVPPLVKYLGKLLPMAVIAALVIYCLRGITFSAPSGFVPALAAAGVTVVKLCLLDTAAYQASGRVLDLLNWKSLLLFAVIWVLTNPVKQTKKLHPVVFIAFSAAVGIAFRFAGA